MFIRFTFLLHGFYFSYPSPPLSLLALSFYSFILHELIVFWSSAFFCRHRSGNFTEMVISVGLKRRSVEIWQIDVVDWVKGLRGNAVSLGTNLGGIQPFAARTKSLS
jgi:hypothetical protein